MKPLTVIMFIVIFTWPISVILFALVRTYVPPENLTKVSLYMSWIFFFGVSSHYFVFFIFSKDYKQAFLRQLSCLPCGKKSSTVPVITMAITKSSSLAKKKSAPPPTNF
uniref:G-protein coupled receptors family 1 profile domain-containing protein n=1 Tax=Acrobeloides nanus TaxID=290746 RepID=A0A914CNY7_9BILA